MKIYDYNHSQKVPVIASFSADGKIIPLYVQVTSGDERINLSVRVLSFEDHTGIIFEYLCEYEHNNRTKRMNLYYNIKEHTWTL